MILFVVYSVFFVVTHKHMHIAEDRCLRTGNKCATPKQTPWSKNGSVYGARRVFHVNPIDFVLTVTTNVTPTRFLLRN